ncbi:MAG TPA: MFS transporter [Bryobacteraceae bacterium]|nr:MFS transporter [Bryobacteraceae bacterium]
MQKKPFYGWWVTVAAICTFGIAVGIPYYNMPFFYDYYEKAAPQGGFGWTRDQITLGFPLAALFTLWVGPALVHRFSPRKLILIGTGATAAAFIGFSRMSGDINIYYVLWFVYTVGYIFSGPIPHQVIISQWFRKKRGRAMGITYVGVAVFGSIGSYIVKPLSESLGFRGALAVMGGLMFLAWPLALFIIKDRPSDKGLYPDNDAEPLAVPVAEPQSMGSMLGKRAFWLLVIGSLCSIGSIGAINQHMKLVFKDHGFVDQAVLNSTWRTASILILWSSIAGRLLVGWMADRFPKKYVMTGTYALVAATIPLLLLVKPGQDEYLYFFAILFGFGMGADYMLIPLMAAEQFGVNTLARAMAIILPTDTIGQTWFPYFVSLLRKHFGDYEHALMSVFVMAAIGAAAIAMLPKYGRQDETLHVPESERAAARR